LITTNDIKCFLFAAVIMMLLHQPRFPTKKNYRIASASSVRLEPPVIIT